MQAVFIYSSNCFLEICPIGNISPFMPGDNTSVTAKIGGNRYAKTHILYGPACGHSDAQ